MVKRIFAIIGIVVGSVAAFVGAVVGVMAAMGKFKTPIVKPKTLEFETSEMRIVPKSSNEDDILSDAYSFTIVATNSSYSEKVNQRDCKLWFEKGENLIELGRVEDGEWKVLSADRYSRYEVKCNETLYFKLKPYSSANNEGTAILNARSDAGQVDTKKPLTIYIDRIIESVFVNKNVEDTTSVQENPITHRKELTQNITIGTGVRLNFDYLINPEYSLKPISTEAAKEIELYYDDKNVEGYTKITKEAIKSGTLSSIFGYDDENDIVYLNSQAIGEFVFKIAVFPTYQEKENYEASLEGAVDNIYNRLDNMLVTNLRISVVNSNILQVNMVNPGVVLSLYSQNDYVVLNNSNSTTATNLGISMLSESGETFVRFDEVDFNLINSNIRDEAPRFKTLSGEQELININQLIANGTLTIGNFELSNIWLNENMVIINCLNNYGGYNYYSQNGAAIAVLEDNEIKEIKMLNSGSYLDFYTNSASGNILLNDASKIEIEAPTGEGRNKTWRVITKEILENVRIGILVVNGEGSFVPDSFYSSVAVEIFATDLLVELTSNDYSLDVSYLEQDGETKIVGEEIPVLTTTDNLGLVSVKTTSGYNAVAFVTPEAETYGVEVVERATFTYDGNKYVLVGYVSENRFVNSVKSTGETAESVRIYLLNLFNGYNQTTEDLINSLIFTQTDGNIVETDADLSDFGKLTFDSISISPYFVLNADLVSARIDENIKTDDGTNYYAYAGTEHTLTLSSDAENMLKNVFNQLDLSSRFADYFKVLPATNSVSIQSVALNNKDIVVTFATQTEFEQNVKIVFNFDVDIKVESIPFKVKSNKPENIVLQTTSNELDNLVLYSSKESALNENSSYINIELGYSEGTTLSYTVFNKENNTETPVDAFVFNPIIIKDTVLGFKDAEFKINSNVTYSSLDENIFTMQTIAGESSVEIKLNAKRTGNAVLEVTINDVSKYICIKITSSISLNTKEFSNPIIYATGNSLRGFVEFSDASIPLNDDTIKFVDLVYTSYGAGAITISETVTGFAFKDAGDNEVLTISIVDGEWKFTRTNSVHIPISIRFGLYSVYGGIESISITFSSTTFAEFNIHYLVDDNYVIYKSAEPASLYIHQTESADFGEGEYPFMRVVSPSATPVITTEIYDKDNHLKENNLGDLTFGEYSIYLTVEDIRIGPFYFSVYPNILVTNEKIGDQNVKTIAHGDNLLKLFVFTKYNDCSYSTITNISDITGLPTSNLEVEITGDIKGNVLYKSNAFEVEDIKEISSSLLGKITLKYNDTPFSLVLAEADITLTSSKTVSIDYDYANEGVFTYRSGQTYVCPVTDASNSPSSIEFYDGATKLFELSVTSGEFTVPFISVDYDNVSVVFKFAGDYTYTTSLHSGAPIFNLKGYVPTMKDVKTTAYSGTNYDLIKDVFDEDALKDDENIKSIQINSISKQVIENQTSLNLLDIGYYKNGENDYLFTGNIKFAELSGNKIDFVVTYLITYDTNETYLFDVEFTLLNRQQITLTSPIQGLKFNDKSFVFYNQTDALNLNPQAQENPNRIYTISEMAYEPMLIYSVTTKTNSIDFTSGTYVNRVVVENKKIDGTDTDNKNLTIPSITLVAYSNSGSFATYASQVRNALTNSTTGYSFTFPQASKSTQGYLIFKVETNSGNFDYYCIYVFCEGQGPDTDSIDRKLLNASNEANISFNVTESETTFASIVGTYSEYLKGKLGWKWNDNIELYLLDAKYTVGKDYVEDAGDLNGLLANKYKKVNGDKIPTFTNYAQIALAAVYNNGTAVYNFGTIIINVTPSATESVSDSELFVSSGNGIYNRTIEASEYNNSDLTIANPFTVEDSSIENVAFVGTEPNENIVAISSNDVVIKARVTEELTFGVKYTFDNGLVIIVYYTYEPTIVEGEKTITIGAFDVVQEKFNNKIAISDIIGNEFNGTIKIEGNELDLSDPKELSSQIKTNDVIINNTVDDPTHLTFSQTTEDKTISLKIEFVGLIDSNGDDKTVTYTFVVKQGLYITTTTSQEGVTSGKRLNTTLTNNYFSSTGSELKVVENGSGIAKYSFGGYVIYALNGSKLQFTFDNTAEENGYASTNYVSTPLASLNHSAQLDSSGSVGFVHLAEEKDINVELTVLNDDYKTYANSTRNVYLTISQTYSSIKAKYAQTGADHENVTKGKEISDLFDDLFVTNKKIDLFNTNNAKVDEDKVDFEEMGFKNSYNPNFITFTATGTSNATLSYNEEYNKTSIKFASVESNRPSHILISNNAGISNVAYNFYILNSTKTDDLILNSNYSTGPISDWEYISLLIDDHDRVSAYSSGNLTVGRLLDDTCNVLKIEVDGGVTVKTNSTLNFTPTTDKYNVKNGQSEGLDITIDFDNGLVYKITFGDYKVYIIYDNDSYLKPIYARFVRSENIDTINELHLKLTLTGSTSSFTKEILFCNYQIEEPYATSYDSVYGRNVIDIIETEKIKIRNEGADLGFSLSENSMNNGLFSFDEGHNLLTLSNVGQTQTETIEFNIKSGEYVIKQALYNVIVNRNLVFVVNGESVTETTGNDEIALESNYKLNLNSSYVSATSSHFPITVPINYTGDTAGDMKLVLQLHAPHRSNTSESTLISNGLSMVEMKFAEGANEEDIDTIIAIDNVNHKLIFYHDFTGDITLTLTCKTEFGDYSTNWVISVQGLLTFTNVGASSVTKLSDTGSPYYSNTLVDIVSNTSGLGVGAVLTIGGFPKTETGTAPNIITTYGKLTERKFEYVIVENNAVNRSADNKTIFDSVDENNQNEYIRETNNNLKEKYSIRLPYVPATNSSADMSYIVVFKLTFGYLNQQTITVADPLATDDYKVELYIGYYVVNYAAIEVYQDDKVPIDSNNNYKTLNSEVVTVEERVYNKGTDYYLDMFYYKETYETAGDTWEAFCIEEDGVIYDVLTDGTHTYYYYNDDSNSNDAGCYYSIKPDEEKTHLTSGTRYKIVDGKLKCQTYNSGWGNEVDTIIYSSTTSTNYAERDNNMFYYSVFRSNFVNVHTFTDFIKSVDSIRLTNPENNNDYIKFSVDYIENGRWGIELASGKRSGTPVSPLFSNELICDLQVLQKTSSGIESVTKTISAFNSTTGRGFKLTSKYKIEHKSILLGDIVGQNIAGDYADYEIIGVTNSTSGTFGKIGSIEGYIGDKKTTSKITLGSQQFDIYQITFTGSSYGYYEIAKSYYVIGGVASLIAPNYAGSINIDTYIVKGNSINLTNVFNNYFGEFTDSSGVSPITSGITVSGLDSTLSYSGTTLTYSGSINKTFEITATISGKQVPLRIRFILNTTNE